MYPADVAGIRARIVSLDTGVRVRLLEYGAAGGEPVLQIHGWGACVYTYRFAAEALERAGRRVLAFDLRGHGLSDKPIARGAYTTSALVRDVHSLLDTLRVERADVIGHSLGGAIALHLALAQSHRIRRLVLAAPVGLTGVPLRTIARMIAPRFTDHFARHLTPKWLIGFLVRGAYGDPLRVADRTIDEYWAPSQVPEYFRAVRALVEEFDWHPLPAGELARIACPTLVILGTADRLIRDAESAARLIPRSIVFSLEGAGHLGIEECPTEFNRALVEFLAPGVSS